MAGLFKKKAPVVPAPVEEPVHEFPTPPRVQINLGPMRKFGSPLLVPKPAGAIKGVDLSHYQPKVNWANIVREGFEFAFFKATDGLGSKDSMFDAHRKAAAERGIPSGAYHFMRFGRSSAKEEAEQMVKATGGVRSGELPHVIDVEWDKRNSRYDDETMDDAAADEALEIAQRVRDITKHPVMIYTSYPFFRGFSKPERFFEFLLWAPAYGNVSGPRVPLPWSGWAFWQYTDKHPAAKSITGDANLDANYFYGSRATLDLLRKQ